MNTAIIGKIPGYNHNIDPGGHFQKVLLRDVTYIDMIPATYALNEKIFSQEIVLTQNLYKYQSGKKDATKVTAIYKDVLKTMGTYLLSRFKKAMTSGGITGKGYSSMYHNASDMLTKAEKLIKDFSKIESIRLIAANDSTFTESISNSYSQRGAIDNISTALLGKAGNFLSSQAGFAQRLQTISYDKALTTLTDFSSGNSLMDIISGKLLGLQFSSPSVWQESNYAGTLSVFLKLASPSGDPLSILKYITLPILQILGASSPLTRNGLTYGMPLIWDIRAYGITRFKVGAVMALTISRGSYETVFNQDKQPLLVDVRLTIAPLVNDYAVQYMGDKKSAFNKISPETQSNIKQKALKTEDAFGKEASKSLSSAIGVLMESFNTLFTLVAGAIKNTNIAVFKNMYFEHGLGVSSPSEEIEGLLGLGADVSQRRADQIGEVPNAHTFVI